MSKAKTASKNNPTTRASAVAHFHNGKKIRPVKIISGKSTFSAAEYEDSGEEVRGPDGAILPWDRAKNAK